jgi:hypothetical protein
MRYRLSVSASLLLMVSAAIAQTAPPSSSSTASDSWSTHPAASSSSYASHSSMDTSQTPGHFKFKDRNDRGPMSQPPPTANDKASVMGTDRAWQNGRPPLDCAQTPQDSKCH